MILFSTESQTIIPSIVVQGIDKPHEVDKRPRDNKDKPVDRVELSQDAQVATKIEPVKSDTGEELNDAEQKQLEKLKRRDREVKQHEQAHLSAGGAVINGGPHYTYQRGPDGRNYAVGGSVSIDTSEGKTPEETIRKMQSVKRAALAPGDPSAQDRAVAADAAQKEAKARVELMNKEKKPDELLQSEFNVNEPVQKNEPETNEIGNEGKTKLPQFNISAYLNALNPLSFTGGSFAVFA